jgi:viroplasmin and RNaseH domain-containing protein
MSCYNWSILKLDPLVKSVNLFKGAPGSDFKYFSTREAAEAYKESNMLLFSAVEINELMKNSTMMFDSSIHLKMGKMIKEKLEKL